MCYTSSKNTKENVTNSVAGSSPGTHATASFDVGAIVSEAM